MLKLPLRAAFLAAGLSSGTQATAGSWDISVYSGWQTSPHSHVSGNDPLGAGPFRFTAGWLGRSFEAPPYYGLRATWWQTEDWGWSADFTHSKVYADSATLGAGGTSGGFDTLEFTDGLNNLTFGFMRRWQRPQRKLTPYAGASLGVVIPHVEVQTTATSPLTFEYQVAGPSIAWVAGASYALTEDWSVFGEYKGSYSELEANLVGGGVLRTDIITNALNFGATYHF